MSGRSASIRPIRSGLPLPVSRVEIVTAISMTKNPGKACVACMVNDTLFARVVGEMTNLRAAWFAAEFALDLAQGKPASILTCITELPKGRDIATSGWLGRDRDLDVISRVRKKFGDSEVVFRRKRDEPRFDTVRAHAKASLDFDEWQPPPLETEQSIASVIGREVEHKVESPLESVLLKALKRYFPEPTVAHPYRDRPTIRVPAFKGEFGTLIPQLRCGPYRADFAIVNPMTKLFVEVDGYECHDVREQRDRDRERDRYLMARGWRVPRFSGRQVYRNPYQCAEEVMEILRGLE